MSREPDRPDRPTHHRRPDPGGRLRRGGSDALLRGSVRLVGRSPLGTGERAQSTVEYALVLLGAAAVALALVAWVARSDAVARLFDAIVGRILSQA